ncbi:MAG: hypothetical protein PHS82_16135 [Lachnospiraceae bacterium]|nr:hypothetical protein [Lachnospiraceae bacterium]
MIYLEEKKGCDTMKGVSITLLMIVCMNFMVFINIGVTWPGILSVIIALTMIVFEFIWEYKKKKLAK